MLLLSSLPNFVVKADTITYSAVALNALQGGMIMHGKVNLAA